MRASNFSKGCWCRGRWLPQTTAASRLTRLDKLRVRDREEGNAGGKQAGRLFNSELGNTGGTPAPLTEWAFEKKVCETNSPVNWAFCKDLERGALGSGRVLDLFLLFVGEDAGDAGVGGEPEEGDGDEEGVGDPGVDEGEGDGEEVERRREFAFPVVADGGGEEGVGALLFDDGGLQNVVGDGGHEEDEAVDGGGYRPEMVFADPGGGEREKREPEEQMEVRPEDAAADAFGGLEEVVMVVPVDADVDETEDVAEKDGQERFQGGEVGGVRDFQFQHHDGDDDGEDAVAEGFEPGGFHCAGAGCLRVMAFAERKVAGARRSWTEGAQLTSREGVLLVAS